MSMALYSVQEELFIFVSWVLVLLVVWYWIGRLTLRDNDEEEEDIESGEAHSSRPETRNMSFVTANARARRIPWHQILVSFTPKTQMAKLAVRALPPVTPFREDQTAESQNQCPICIEHFTNGELIQPFGVCVHQFHHSCIHSWLLHGKTNCPVCRMELSVPLHH